MYFLYTLITFQLSIQMNSYKSPYQDLLNQIKKQKLYLAQQILKNKSITINNKIFKFQYFIHGQKPTNGYRLIFGFHGGGGCPPQVNQQQWNNHKHLYDGLLPSGTIWFVPRSAQQASDMWWKPYIPDFITSIIVAFSIMNMINTNRVFVTGYSAGGDGIYHVATMIADLIAGAAMMAGHPNQADCYNLRNIAFSIQVGQNDHAYDRANWGKVYINKIEELQKQYEGFKQYSQVHRNTQHWMNKKDAKIFPKLFNEERNPYPQFILFRQHPRTFKRTFYFLRLQQKHQGLICVRRKGNIFEIQAQQLIPINLMINQRFVNFNENIIIRYNGQQTIRKPNKQQLVIQKTAQQFIDREYIFEDEIFCVPGTNLPKDYKILRPFNLEGYPSSWDKIKQMQRCIVQDNKLHVSFKNKKEYIVDQQIREQQQNNVGEYRRGDKRERNMQRRTFLQKCEMCCMIY